VRTPNAHKAEIPPAKITHYLLSLGSLHGRGKAIFFQSKGFTLPAWKMLAEALQDHVQTNDYVSVSPTPWGTKYTVEGPLRCPDGSTAHVRSVWNIKPPATHPRLITAHPLRRARR